jgi:hypothetical protein
MTTYKLEIQNYLEMRKCGGFENGHHDFQSAVVN